MGECTKLGLEIKISGPGGCINTEVSLIANFLREKGFEVEIQNRHPSEKPFDIKDVNGAGWKVVLIADHQPWGG